MRRRTFIRNIGILTATANIVPPYTDNARHTADRQCQWLQRFTLKEFGEEHEEYPCIVTNHQGNVWMFALRRLSYPDSKELISCFSYHDKTWEENDTVSGLPGQYEYPTASCARGGYPVVAWTSIHKGHWAIEVAVGDKHGFGPSHVFHPTHGKFIRPALITPDPGSAWLAWECFDRGTFSLYL